MPASCPPSRLARRASKEQRRHGRVAALVTGYAHTASRIFPRGALHLLAQVGVWLGFYVVYQMARGAADRGVTEAFANGKLLIETQQRLGLLVEPALQDIVESSRTLITLTSITYWLSQFAIVGLTLLWVYFRHHDRFAGYRNWLIGANLVGLVGYVLVPTAPPRMFPEWGFSDTLAEHSVIHHDSGLIAFSSNQFAAMPSLHAMDALIVGLVVASLCRTRIARSLWLAWPVWVTFAVMGTGNHFWLDCAAGFAIALAVGVPLLRGRLMPTVRAALRGTPGPVAP